MRNVLMKRNFQYFQNVIIDKEKKKQAWKKNKYYFVLVGYRGTKMIIWEEQGSLL